MEQRQLYLDLLRVVSIFAVIVIHVSAPLHDLAKMPMDYWIASNILDSISRFCVPVFFMVSGALLLGDNRNYQFSYLFRKRILRILIPLIGWSIFYLCIFDVEKLNISNLLITIENFLTKPVVYHLWFLYSLLGLYLIVPVLGFVIKKVTLEIVYYFLLVWGLFICLITILRYFTGYHLPTVLPFILSGIFLFSGYFVLGFYLLKKHITYQMWQITSLMAVGISTTIIATHYFSYQQGSFYKVFYSYITPNVLLVSIGIFLLAKAFNSSLEKITQIKRNLLIILSEASFGIYLMHIIILNQVNVRLHLDGNTFHPAIGILLASVCVFVISAILTYMIRQIPLIGKWVT